jgi:hypothetical protein
MGSALDYEGLVAALLEALPEINPTFHRMSGRWGENYLPHVVFGDVVTEHCLIPLLEAPVSDGGLLERAFAFLEAMAKSPDIRVREVVEVTVCERLQDRPEWIRKARMYMGPETLRFVSGAE